MSKEFVYFSGDYDLPDNFIDLDNGTIPAAFLIDSNSLYGDGTFEGIRIYNGRIFKLHEHLDRLWNSASSLQIKMPCTKKEMAATLCELGHRNEIRGTGYIRLVVTRGRRLDLGINTRKVNRATVFIIARELQLYPKEFYEKGLSVITARVRRTPKNCVDPNVKTCNYINNIMAVIEANAAEVPEVIMLTTEGVVCECSADNIFIVKDGLVITPPEENILVGVTRNTILSLCKRLKIPATEENFGPEAVHNADEVFLTGSGAEVAPIVEVDKRRIADGRPGPVTRRLMAAFRTEVENPAKSVAISVAISDRGE
ncbi:MAG: branched-chain-amino-acid transaminase [Candidatus Glassbacteria bacterium]|nr:branched-chain-amino-acid transaminase [Candidatus Glassbacteria bacterium]